MYEFSLENATFGVHLERIRALPKAHQDAILRFHTRVVKSTLDDHLCMKQALVAVDFLVRLGELGRNPANTGNLEDLFFHTLYDTKDPKQAFVQMVADSYKVVPLDPDLELFPHLEDPGGKLLTHVRDLVKFTESEKMLIAHTMVAFSCEETKRFVANFYRYSYDDEVQPKDDDTFFLLQLMKDALHSQHMPSSAFVLACMKGYIPQVEGGYLTVGYSPWMARNVQRFYDNAAKFKYEWLSEMWVGLPPNTDEWRCWQRDHLALKQHLPPELKYQLHSDTLTNFHAGTMESGKWVDLTVGAGKASDSSELPREFVKLITLYIAEYVHLHGLEAAEFIASLLDSGIQDWGICYRGDDFPQSCDPTPEKALRLREQFEAACEKHNVGKKEQT